MRAFFGSMTGRLFLILVIGVITTAALSLWLAGSERQRALGQYRDSQIIERSEQLVMTADTLPASARHSYVGAVHRPTIRLDMEEVAGPLTSAPSEFASALAARLGPGFQVHSLQQVPAACLQARESSGWFGGGNWHGTCESVNLRLRDGQGMSLSVLPPRSPPGTHRAEFFSTTNIALFVISISLLAYLVARMATRPLKQLAQAAKDLGNDINHPPLALSGAAEIRQASAAFNAMQARIRQYIFQRTQMLAAITHDLQTPLTRMRLRLEKVADPELQARLIGDLSAMQAMVREGLDLARSMDTNEAMQALDLDSLLDSVCSDAVEAGQDVQLDGRVGMAMLGRPMALRRCLVNLVDNAVKYGQRAQVTVEPMVGAARIRIRDGGPGIDAAELARVFEPFYRIEGSRSRESGGTGLGLTIARNIAEQHGGSLMLANHPQGGLEVTLTLPEYYAGK